MTRMRTRGPGAAAASGRGAQVACCTAGAQLRRGVARPAPRPRHRLPRAPDAACAAAGAPAPARGRAPRRRAACRRARSHARPAACCSCRRARATRRARHAPPARSGGATSADEQCAPVRPHPRAPRCPARPGRRPAVICAGSNSAADARAPGPGASGRPRPARWRRSWPSSSLRSRVSRLPRSGSMRRSGRSASNCTTRRRLEVPTQAPCGRSCRRAKRGLTKASRGSSRSSTAAEHEAGRQLHRHVLQRMHGQVRAAVFERRLQFLDEQALAADLGQRAVEDLVAARGHAEQFDLQAEALRAAASRTCSACHRARRLSRVAMMVRVRHGACIIASQPGHSPAAPRRRPRSAASLLTCLQPPEPSCPPPARAARAQDSRPPPRAARPKRRRSEEPPADRGHPPARPHPRRRHPRTGRQGRLRADRARAPAVGGLPAEARRQRRARARPAAEEPVGRPDGERDPRLQLLLAPGQHRRGPPPRASARAPRARRATSRKARWR